MPNEQDARAQIDKLLTLAGWDVQEYGRASTHAARVAICESVLDGWPALASRAARGDLPRPR